ncbi:VOC family protein [Streptosporangium sp. NBC_01756]|uniref:VOC family protein n=1 Tax=Streptosporangium sp. NBC_01756 TaxID=2975950 RepID=UPI002DD8FA26|nr:VOC family protein [Streptosporangium sp. NBC_01756]WSC83622.1 VOC family protein [Streptosporangium sp. NBC_01756]
MTFKTGHVGLNVSDLDKSKDFYLKVFGFEVFGESDRADRRYAFLGLDGELVLTLWQQSEGRADTGLPGLHHLSFQVPDIEAVRRAETVIREVGATLHHDGVVPHGEGASSGGVFFEDPDGIRLEIFAPTGAGERPAPTTGAPTCGFF